MSLNRSEQTLLEYVQTHQEERLYWQEKVRRAVNAGSDTHDAARRLEGEIWRYFEERARFVRRLAEVIGGKEVARVSMRNLAEYWIRLWTRPKVHPASMQKEGFKYGDL